MSNYTGVQRQTQVIDCKVQNADFGSKDSHGIQEMRGAESNGCEICMTDDVPEIIYLIVRVIP